MFIGCGRYRMLCPVSFMLRYWYTTKESCGKTAIWAHWLQGKVCIPVTVKYSITETIDWMCIACTFLKGVLTKNSCLGFVTSLDSWWPCNYAMEPQFPISATSNYLRCLWIWLFQNACEEKHGFGCEKRRLITSPKLVVVVLWYQIPLMCTQTLWPCCQQQSPFST